MSSPPRSRSSTPGLNDYANEVIPGGDRCLKCNAQGHWVQDCPLATCFHCREKGHIMDDCPDKANIKCYGCSGFGHLRKECPKIEDNASSIAVQEELRETRRKLQDTQEQLRRAQQKVSLLSEDLREANDKHERWRKSAQSNTMDPYEALRMLGLHKNLQYTQLRKVNPYAAEAQLQFYGQYVRNTFNQNPDILSRTINILVHDINIIEVKQSNGNLRWRYDVAFALARQISEALLKYGYGRTPLDGRICLALQAVDTQLSLIVEEMLENFGDEVNLRNPHDWIAAEQKRLKQIHGITEYYPGTTVLLGQRIQQVGYR
ncbi:uncharacterized protein J4E78_009041 [Alternaria triticimaculans]|uniref:uncharacterized protein n=1 Tax=Alternaria triticimaculans TaxID=297637 RepID=UPI0020C3E22D|nr:uncharacterized protein J4E78_009041 [Alternaria triticimaculans]KAI4647069.1 hypothetical protein J4E78_009041 [Alternaria triticimaculans]